MGRIERGAGMAATPFEPATDPIGFRGTAPAGMGRPARCILLLGILLWLH
jgi:hypothetical protein